MHRTPKEIVLAIVANLEQLKSLETGACAEIVQQTIDLVKTEARTLLFKWELSGCGYPGAAKFKTRREATIAAQEAIENDWDAQEPYTVEETIFVDRTREYYVICGNHFLASTEPQEQPLRSRRSPDALVERGGYIP
jgi:hypothetical protein